MINTVMARTSSIVVGPCTEKLDRAKIARYRQALRRGDTFPAIAVIKHPARLLRRLSPISRAPA
jgi:hypothetical protein